MQKKIKYGVIGVGHLGNFHVKQLLNIGSVELIGVYDENPKRLNEISQNYNLPKIEAIKDLLK